MSLLDKDNVGLHTSYAPDVPKASPQEPASPSPCPVDGVLGRLVGERLNAKADQDRSSSRSGTPEELDVPSTVDRRAPPNKSTE